mgnify:CR=1 FL=1
MKEDDLDVVITCNVMNYGGDLNFVELEWSFVYDDETVTLMAPHQKYLRIAKRVSYAILLFMLVRFPKCNFSAIFPYYHIALKSKVKDIGNQVYCICHR